MHNCTLQKLMNLTKENISWFDRIRHKLIIHTLNLLLVTRVFLSLNRSLEDISSWRCKLAQLQLSTNKTQLYKLWQWSPSISFSTCIMTYEECCAHSTMNTNGGTEDSLWSVNLSAMWSPWKTHWALTLVKGVREPHEVKTLPRVVPWFPLLGLTRSGSFMGFT